VSCNEVRQVLDEGPEGLSPDLRAHVETCAACRRHAALLATLSHAEPSESDAELVQRIVNERPTAAWQLRRWSTWLPIAAGVGLIAAGVGMIGGVPAPRAVSELPAVGHGFAALLSAWWLDSLAAVRGGTDAARTLVAAGGATLILWLAFTAVGSGWFVRALVRGRVGGPHR
jgi:hypothetical protein